MFPNPSLDIIVNAANYAAFAIQKGFHQDHIDTRIDQLVRYLQSPART